MGWRWGTPQKGHGTSGSIMEWRWCNPPPPGVDGQTPVKTLPFRIPLEMQAVKTGIQQIRPRFINDCTVLLSNGFLFRKFTSMAKKLKSL